MPLYPSSFHSISVFHHLALSQNEILESFPDISLLPTFRIILFFPIYKQQKSSHSSCLFILLLLCCTLLSTSRTAGASDWYDLDTYLLGIRNKLGTIPLHASLGLQKKSLFPNLTCSNISSQDIQSKIKFYFNCKNFTILLSVI